MSENELSIRTTVCPYKFKGSNGIKRLLHGLGYSISAWQHEAAIRQEIFSALILIPLATFVNNLNLLNKFKKAHHPRH